MSAAPQALATQPGAATRPMSPWARHLAEGPAAGTTPLPGLTPEEAERVQRYRDQLLAALRARDRGALRCAKAQVLAAAFGPRDKVESAALARALRELSWSMAGWLLPRSRTL